MPGRSNLPIPARYFLILLSFLYAVHEDWDLMIRFLIMYQLLAHDHRADMAFGGSRPHHQTSAADYRAELHRDATDEGRLFSPTNETIQFSTTIDNVEPYGIQDTQPHNMPAVNHFINIQRMNVFEDNQNHHMNEDATLYTHTADPVVQNVGHDELVVNEHDLPEQPFDADAADENLTDSTETKDEVHCDVDSHEHKKNIVTETSTDHIQEQTSTVTESNSTTVINSDVSNQTNPTSEQLVPAAASPEEYQEHVTQQDAIAQPPMTIVDPADTGRPKPPGSIESTDRSEEKSVR